LLSASDDKTLRCWDLSQDGKCVKTLMDVHGHFVTALRWAPGVAKGAAAVNGNGNGDKNGANGLLTAKKSPGDDVQIRCVIATGSVDLNVRIFAN
jgi:platelet-activating factor acetylhydrolase IB subunit alpha